MIRFTPVTTSRDGTHNAWQPPLILLPDKRLHQCSCRTAKRKAVCAGHDKRRLAALAVCAQGSPFSRAKQTCQHFRAAESAQVGNHRYRQFCSGEQAAHFLQLPLAKRLRRSLPDDFVESLVKSYPRDALCLPDYFPDADGATRLLLDTFERPGNVTDFRPASAGGFAHMQVSATEPDGRGWRRASSDHLH